MSRIVRMLWVAGIAALAGAGFAYVAGFDPHTPYDALVRAQLARDEEVVPAGVLIVDFAGAQSDRRALAALLEACAALQLRGVVLDLFLSREHGHPDIDRRLAAAMRALVDDDVPVVLAVEPVFDADSDTWHVDRALEVFQLAGVELATASLQMDRGHIRGAAGYAIDGPSVYFGLAAWIATLLDDGAPPSQEAAGEAIAFGPASGRRQAAVERRARGAGSHEGVYRIDWGASPGRPAVVPGEIVQLAGERGASLPEDLKAAYRDHVLVIGQYAPAGNPDLKSVPARSRTERIPGVECHVLAALSLRAGRPPRAPTWLGAVLAGLAAALALLIGLVVLRRAWMRLAWGLGLAFLYFDAAIRGYELARWTTPIGAVYASALFALVLHTLLRARDDRRDLLRYRAGAASREGEPAPSAAVALPAPVAEVLALARGEPPGSRRFRRLLEAAEVLLHLLFAVVASEERERAGPRAVKQRLGPGVRKPGPGAQLYLLRTTLADGRAASEMRGAARALAADWQRVPEIPAALARIVELRNRFKGHGALLPGTAYAATAETLEADLRFVLSGLTFLQAHPLVEVVEVVADADGHRARLREATSGETQGRFFEAMVANPVAPSRLATHDRVTGRLLDLAPWCVRIDCERHQQPETAVFNGMTSTGRPKYLSYATGCGARALTPGEGVVTMFRQLTTVLILLLLPAALAFADDEEPPQPKAPVEEDEPKAAVEPALAYVQSIRPKGGASLERVGAKARPLLPLEALHAGDVVTPKTGATVLLVMSGKVRRLTERTVLGTAKVAEETAKQSGSVMAALGELFKAITEETAHPTAGGVHRGPGDAKPLEPRGRLLTARPAFRWSSALSDDGALLWVVAVPDEGPETTAVVLPVKGAGFAWPEHADALAPGVYKWAIVSRAATAGGTLTDDGVAWFNVLPPATRRDYKQRIQAFRTSLTIDDPVVRALAVAGYLQGEPRFLTAHARDEVMAAIEAGADDPSLVMVRDYLAWLLGYPGAIRPVIAASTADGENR